MHFSWSSCRFILTFEQVFPSEWSDKITTSPQTTLKLWNLNTHKHTQVYSRDPMQGWECTGRRQHTIKSTSSESWYHSNQSCLSMWPSGPKNRQWAPLSPNPRTQAGTVAESWATQLQRHSGAEIFQNIMWVSFTACFISWEKVMQEGNW